MVRTKFICMFLMATGLAVFCGIVIFLASSMFFASFVGKSLIFGKGMVADSALTEVAFLLGLFSSMGMTSGLIFLTIPSKETV